MSTTSGVATTELRKIIQDAGEHGVSVLVDFWAPWCGPCRVLAPQLDAIAKERGESLLVLKVNVDSHPDAAKSYQVTSLPTLIVFKGGEEHKRNVGAINLKALREFTQIED
jgi:thioredoxin 1